MSSNWVDDIEVMHNHYKVHDAISTFTPEKLKALLKFRIAFLEEELTELKDAQSAEDVVDALIDLCVVAIGTLDCFQINSERAWNEILRANMQKETGIKKERPNPLGLPDLVKPEGWRGPEHTHNHGTLDQIEYPL